MWKSLWIGQRFAASVHEANDPERLARDALTAIDVLGELGDDIGLSRSWSLLGEARWMTGRLAEAAENYEHAAEHARRALSRRDEAWAAGQGLGIEVTVQFGEEGAQD